MYTPPTNTYFAFDADESRKIILENYTITKLLVAQSFSKVWKIAVRQKFFAIASKIWPCNIICWPLREHILFAYPSNFTAGPWLRKNYIGYLELSLATCNNEKSVVVWNASFRLAPRSFKNTGPYNSMIFNRWIEECFGGHHPGSSRLENCNTYFALMNMKHSRKKITNWI